MLGLCWPRLGLCSAYATLIIKNIYLQLFELGHWDHHILHVSKAWLSASQQHQAKHQPAAEAQGGLGHAILLQARCSWQLSACGLVGGLRGSRSHRALGDKDQVHGGHSQAACQEQRAVAGHVSKTAADLTAWRILRTGQLNLKNHNAAEKHVKDVQLAKKVKSVVLTQLDIWNKSQAMPIRCYTEALRNLHTTLLALCNGIFNST